MASARGALPLPSQVYVQVRHSGFRILWSTLLEFGASGFEGLRVWLLEDYTITAAKHDKSLEWLLQHSSTEDTWLMSL